MTRCLKSLLPIKQFVTVKVIKVSLFFVLFCSGNNPTITNTILNPTLSLANNPYIRQQPNYVTFIYLELQEKESGDEFSKFRVNNYGWMSALRLTAGRRGSGLRGEGASCLLVRVSTLI